MPIALADGIPSNEYFNGKPFFAGNLRYVPTYWEDLRTPANAFQGAGINDPTFALFRNNGVGSVGVYTWQFSATVQQDLFFWLQLPHSWKQGSTIYPHLHWGPMTAAAGDVAWSFEYTLAKIGDPFPITAQDNLFEATSGVQYDHQVSSFTPIVTTGLLISSMFGCRLRRRAANPLDTYPGLAALFEFDIHYEVDTPGSRQQTVK